MSETTTDAVELKKIATFLTNLGISDEEARDRWLAALKTAADQACVCPIAKSVSDRIRERANFGFKKYGHTCAREDMTQVQWLRSAQEEAMDLCVYLERCIQNLNGGDKPIEMPKPVAKEKSAEEQLRDQLGAQVKELIKEQAVGSRAKFIAINLGANQTLRRYVNDSNTQEIEGRLSEAWEAQINWLREHYSPKSDQQWKLLAQTFWNGVFDMISDAVVYKSVAEFDWGAIIAGPGQHFTPVDRVHIRMQPANAAEWIVLNLNAAQVRNERV